MAENNFEKLADAYEFGSTYPVTTTPSSGSTGTTATTTAPSQLQQLVTGAIQGVLGRSFKPGDHRSFKAALEVSFEYKEVEGRPTYAWKPRAYPAVGATDLGGGVSGAQYSLVSFASTLHRQAEPLIEGLHSLVPDVDEENFEAARAIFKTAWDEFVSELAREGGARPPRANALAASIFSEVEELDSFGRRVRRPPPSQDGGATTTTTTTTTPVTTPPPGSTKSAGSKTAALVGTKNAASKRARNARLGSDGSDETEGKAAGHLVRLGALLGVIDAEFDEETGAFTVDIVNGRFEFTRENVVTSEEEGRLTSFIALTDYFFAVANSWQFYFNTFFKEKKDLGGRLLGIERQLAVIEDGVNEVFVAMDSVNVDQSERLVININFDGDDDMSVEDFLSWIATFASSEAPELLTEGGKWGVQALVPTVAKLHNLTVQFINKLEKRRGAEVSTRSKSGLPKQFSHSRVLDPLNELERYLEALLETAKSDF